MSNAKELEAQAADRLDSLFRRYGTWLDARLRTRLGPDEAADMVQETYLRIAPYDNDSIRHPKAFLLRVALNLVRDDRRRRARRARFLDQQPAAEAQAASQLDQILLKQIVLTMPPLYRDIFVLNRFGGMGCRHARRAPEPLPVGETGVAKARADRPEGDRPACTSLTAMTMLILLAGAEGRGDRPVRRRSRFTLACARAEPLALPCRGVALKHLVGQFGYGGSQVDAVHPVQPRLPRQIHKRLLGHEEVRQRQHGGERGHVAQIVLGDRPLLILKTNRQLALDVQNGHVRDQAFGELWTEVPNV